MNRSDPTPSRRLSGRILANGVRIACAVHDLGPQGARLTLPNAAGVPERFTLETDAGTFGVRTGLRRQGVNGADLWVSFETRALLRAA